MMPAISAAPGQAGPSPPKLKIISKIVYLLGARWFQEGLQTIFFIYLARVSTATYGEFMMALGLGSILLMTAEFGLNLPFVSLAAGSRDKTNDALSQVLVLKGLFFLLALAGCLIFITWQDYSPDLKRILFIIGGGVALDAFASAFFVVLQVEGRQDQEAKIRSIGAAVGFGYGLLALYWGAPPLALAFFKLIESGIKVLGGAWLLVGRGKFQWLRPTLRKLQALVNLGLIFAAMEITASIYNKANLFFLQKYGGSEAVGQYSAAWQVVDGFSCLVAGLVLQNILYPVFVRFWQQDRTAVIPLAQKTARWLTVLGLPLMFFLWIESENIILLVYGKKYLQAIWLQRYLVIMILIAFWHNLAVYLLLSMGREKLLLGFYLLGLVINLLLSALVLPLYPLVGAVLAIVITKGVVALLTVVTAQKRLKFLVFKDLQIAGAALLVTIILYFTYKEILPWGLLRLLSFSPFFVLWWYWWKQDLSRSQSF